MYETRWHVGQETVQEDVKEFVKRVESEFGTEDMELAVTNSQTVKIRVYNMQMDKKQEVFNNVEKVAQDVYGVERYRMNTASGEATVTADEE